MLTSFENVLVLAPHTDDGEMGCGGTIARFIQEKKRVYYVAFSTAEQSVPPGFPGDILKTEVKKACHRLGILPENLIIFDYVVRKLNYVRQDILENLMKLKREMEVDLVLMPTPKDIHQDHSTVAIEGLRAFKNKTILGYELIWNNLSFNTDCFVRLQKSHVERKIEALGEYKSQSARDYMKPEFIRSWAKTRGVQIGAEYAEAFEVVRWVIE
jgi:LmbE family N-acetylglucosaminyl deacetylase